MGLPPNRSACGSDKSPSPPPPKSHSSPPPLRSVSQVESGYVCEGDHKTMAKAIKDRVSLIRRKREQRQLVREEQEKRKQEELQKASQVASGGTSGVPPSQGAPQPAAPAPAPAQTELEEPESDQHQQLHYQQAGISMTCTCGSRSALSPSNNVEQRLDTNFFHPAGV